METFVVGFGVGPRVSSVNLDATEGTDVAV